MDNSIIHTLSTPLPLSYKYTAFAVYGQEYLDRITTAADVEAYKDDRFREVLTRFKALVDIGMFSEGTVALNHIQSQMKKVVLASYLLRKRHHRHLFGTHLKIL